MLDIFNFVRSIVTEDLQGGCEAARLDHQRQHLVKSSALLRRPLPLDCSSVSGQVVLNPYLIHHAGSDVSSFVDLINDTTSISVMSTEQVPSHHEHADTDATTTMTESNSHAPIGCCSTGDIMCAVGSSGLGKTHLAYAVSGRKAQSPTTGEASLPIVSIVCRVGEGEVEGEVEGEGGGRAQFSLPILSLREKLAVIAEQSNLVNVKEMAYLYLLVLITSCVDANLRAVEAAVEICPSFADDVCNIQELSLRFSNNKRGEAITNQIFLQSLADMELEGGGGLSEALVEAYTNAVAARGSVYRLLVCLDHAQLLIGTGMFEERKETERKGMKEELYGALCCVLSRLNRIHQWAVYLPGTSVALTTATTSRLKLFHPSGTLTVGLMQSTLQHYWQIEDDVLSHNEVAAALQECVGRPQLFMDALFLPLCTLLRDQQVSDISAELLLEVLQQHMEAVTTNFQRCMERILSTYVGVLPSDGKSAVPSYLPVLLKGILFNGGKIMLDPISSEAHSAIGTGLLPLAVSTPPPTITVIPATSYPSAMNTKEGEGKCHQHHVLDISREEPLVWRALQRAVDQELLCDLRGPGVGAIFRLLLESEKQRGSNLQECTFAFYIALTCYHQSLVARSMDTPFQGVSLMELFAPLFPADISLLPDELSLVFCRATRAVDMSGWNPQSCALRKFVSPITQQADDTLVLYNLPMGVVGAFVGTYSQAPEKYRLVVYNGREAPNASLADHLLSLHPGTQYLTKPQGEYVCRKQGFMSPQKTRTRKQELLLREEHPVEGAGSLAWQDFLRFAAEKPVGRQLTNNWLRLLVVNGEVQPSVIKYIKAADVKRSFKDKWLLRTAPKSKIAADLRCLSPVAVLSLQTKTFFDEPLRNVFLSDNDRMASAGAAATSTLLKFSKKVRWTAVTVLEMKHTLKVVKEVIGYGGSR